MDAALTCGHCGASVRGGRNRCGRCGSAETNAVASKAEGRPTHLPRLAAIGALGLAAVVGFTLYAASGSEPGEAVSSLATTPVATAPTGSGRPQSSDVSGPASVVTAADASRYGAAAYNNGDLASAESHYTTAVATDPNDAAAHNNLGQVLVRTGRSKDAIPHFDKAIELSGDTWSYHFNRARAYAELKDWQQAIAGYTEAARLFPHDYATHFNLAKARQAVGDLPGAIEGYAKAIELAPGQSDFHLTYGQALELAGRQAEAAAAYKRFLEMQPDGPEADKVKARLSQLGGNAEAGPSTER